MKRICLLLSLIVLMINLNAQQPMNDYLKEWKKIDSLIDVRGETKTALAAVEKIYTEAVTKGNDPQIIKSLLYKTSLESIVVEDATLKGLSKLEADASKLNPAGKAILTSIIAERYWNYFQQNRWKFYNRTATVNFKKEDVATWQAEDFHRVITEKYQASIADAGALQKIGLAQFESIIIKGNVRSLRPTLFDLLAHRALSYFQTDEHSITKPADAFEINDPSAFDQAEKFVAATFNTNDTSSAYYNALKTYQAIIRFHLNDSEKSALIDADIARLVFVNEHSIANDKELLYTKSLEDLAKKYGDLPAASQAWFLLAQQHADKARSYNALQEDTYRYEWVKAKEICDKLIAQKDSSEGKINAINLLNEITRQEFSLESEKVIVSGQPFLINTNFRNFTKLYFRLVPVDDRTRKAIKQDQYEGLWNRVVALKPSKTFEKDFPDTKDYQNHNAEINIDGLAAGKYLLVTSTSSKFDPATDALGLLTLNVSSLAWISRDNTYFVVNRETGAPVAAAKVQVYYPKYDNSVRSYVDTKGPEKTTDKNGQFVLEASSENNSRNLKLEITSGKDTLSDDEQIYVYYTPKRAPVNKEKNTTYLFSDRSIYRPGQTIWFKGIVVNNVSKKVAENFSTTISLYDANNQLVDTLKLKTNEYGSVKGQFVLPANLLNGSFTLREKSTNARLAFNVEEYKRPKFEASIFPLTGTYAVNDTVKISGSATAYTGNGLNDAKVKYRVVRQSVYPLWGFGGGYKRTIWPPRPQNEMMITSGETTTKADGSFDISFKAIPDASMNRKNQPVFTYNVTADITDLTGETRSVSQSVSVGYHSLQLSLDVPENLPADSLKTQLKAFSTNLNGLYQRADVTVSMEKLKTPATAFRTKLWSTPDQFVINEAEYRKLFPYDVYKNEDQPSTWAKEKSIFKITDSTNPSGVVKIPQSKPEAGWYKLTATAVDKSGDTVKDVKYIQLTVNDVAVYPGIRAIIKTDKKVAEAGQKVKYRVESNVDELYLIQDVSAKDTMLKRSFYSKVKSTPEQEITLTAAEKGGVQIQVVFVKHNRIFTANERIAVPYTDKELKITYETFRDKIEPGSAEKWKVKISGVKGDKVAAELLSTMYDASLDQFAPNSFNLPYIWPTYYGSERWNSTTFQAISSASHNPEREWKSVDKQYDELLSRGADLSAMLYGAQKNIRLRGINSEAAKKSGTPGAAPVAEARAAELKESNVAIVNQEGLADDGILPPPVANINEKPATTRTNLSELAFFITNLTTDKDGNIEFSFTAPEALTRWKWMSFAHTKDLAFGYNETSIVTKKDLMIQPNATRFVRQGDRFDFSGKITNLTDKEITGQVELQLIDPTTGASVDGWFKNVFPNQFFTAPANQSVPVSFTMEIPYIYNKALTYKMTVRGNDKADGEQGTLPVLSNRILVTESMPLSMRGAGTKKYSFEKLLKSGESETITNHSLTVEYTANPAWFAVQSLPYLADYPRESADQAFNRFYAFSIAQTVAKASPAIRKIAETWKNSDTAALLSQLQKNEELKNVLLAETPWVLQAKTEAEQRKQLALLFDLVRVQNEQQNSLAKLKALQSSNGGFVWFPGGPDDRYITQYILTGIGHLMKLDPAAKADKELQQIVTKALAYLDKRVQESFEQIVKLTKKGAVPDGGLGSYEIQYLYLRGYFRNYPVPGSVLKAYSYYRAQSQKNWLKQSRYMQAMIALSLQATDDVKTALAIVNSLKQNAVINEELGMHWKDNRSGYYWHEAPVEAQAVLIEAFAEITKDVKSVSAMKTWLLKQKQTQSWQTTRSTADAAYALFIDPTGKNSGIQDLLLNTPTVTLKLGSETLTTTPANAGTAKPTKVVTNPSAGTGYLKKTWTEQNVQPAMGNIEVTVTNTKETSLPTWGAVYWQYFENMELVTSANTSLKIEKKLFIEKNNDRGPMLSPITAESPLKIGDKVKVRIEIRNDRDMEYVQLKDMRAAGFEPINVFSGYKYQDGLGYYETTGDASTNFYFSRLPKGTFVFEYPVYVTHNGKFNNGITNIQSLYAPEFTAHSEGLIINVEP